MKVVEKRSKVKLQGIRTSKSNCNLTRDKKNNTLVIRINYNKANYNIFCKKIDYNIDKK